MDFNLSKERAFDEVETRNFNVQPRGLRYPPNDDQLPDDLVGPPIQLFRLNLVALSARHNLYLIASEDKIQIFVPRNLRNTISGTPDLTLELPVSQSGLSVGGTLNEMKPHCVNHIKVGDLGNLEILLIACDDGDAIGYYIHVLDYEIQLLKGQHQTEPLVSTTKPFFHENVGMSAWGLAIHAQSRMIAVSSNLKEITVFAFASYKPPKREDPNDHFRALPNQRDSLKDSEDSTYWLYELDERTYNTLIHKQSMWLETISLYGRVANLRARIRLPPEGHNIPSVDFSSRQDGDAHHLLACDIHGNLWKYDLVDVRKVEKLPSMEGMISRDGHNMNLNLMGWGVLSIPPSMFKDVRLPHAALGMLDLRDAWHMLCRLEPFKSCFNISSSVPRVRHASQLHPSYGASEGYKKVDKPEFELDEDSDSGGTSEKISLKGKLTIKSYRDKLLSLLQPDNPSFYSGELWANEAKAVDESDPFLKDPSIKKSKSEVYWMMSSLRTESELPVRYLQFIFNMGPDRRGQLRLYSWDSITEAYERHGLPIEKRFSYLTPPQRMPISGDNSAVLMIHRYDMQLIPPLYQAFPQIICKSVLKQKMPTAIRAHLQQYDRLCMHALIPDLSLVVIASQVGRAALVCPTRMPAAMSDLGEIITMRLELILPLRIHEHDHRPLAPLLGMAVAPVWSGRKRKAEREGEGEEKVRAKAWRLFLHYMDHTILSYELFRGEDEELVVV